MPAAILDFSQTGKTGYEQSQFWSADMPLQARIETVSGDRLYFWPISYPESSGFLVSGWAPVETLG